MSQVGPLGNSEAVRAATIARVQLQRLVSASRRAVESMPNVLVRPLVTIAIASCNQEHFVADCIRSVIAQDYADIELIIVDDGSSDGSLAVIAALAPECRARFARFAILAHERRGMANTINEAVAWARGTYFALVSADDILFASKTSTLVRELERETRHIVGVFAGGTAIDEHDRTVRRLAPAARIYGFDTILLRRHALLASCHLLVLDRLKKVGSVPPGLRFEDWYLWLALTRRGDRLKVVEGNLVGHRQRIPAVSPDGMDLLRARTRVLDYFADSPVYDVAMARSYLAAAMDHSGTSKRLALQCLWGGLRHSRRILLSRSFLRLTGKLLVPNAGLRALRRLRSEARRPARPA